MAASISKEGVMAGTGSSPWYRSFNRTQWKALIASNLGWTFDGFEVFALILTIGVGTGDPSAAARLCGVWIFHQRGFSWTPIWLPELFPTRMRATASGFIFNA